MTGRAVSAMEPTTNQSNTRSNALERPQPARVFVALKIAPDIAQELACLCAELDESGVRRIPPADIHLTLVPPWNELVIPDAIAKLAEVAATQVAFELKLQHVSYGPEKRRPRLLWAECVSNRELMALRTALFAAFKQTDDRPFRPHVTLARIRTHGAVVARRHPIDRDLTLMQQISSVELMQSPRSGGGTGYTVLASLPLGAATALPRQSAAG